VTVSRFRWHNALALVIALIFALFPIYWMIATSFKPMGEWATVPPTWVPRQFTWSNYAPLYEVFEMNTLTARGTGLGAILQSLIVAGSATVLSLVLGLSAALGFARYRAGGNRLAIAILAVRAIPPVTLAIPALFLFSSIGLRDTFLGIILVNTAFTVPFAFWMLKSFIEDVPKEMEEAGMMDGRSRINAHLFITVPMIRGGMVVTGLFIFVLNWNEFLITMTLSDKNVVTVPIYLHHNAGVYGVQAALAVSSALPIVLFGFLIQKHLARAFTLGAIKR
jgi:multiple sugar transport system permease protein